MDLSKLQPVQKANIQYLVTLGVADDIVKILYDKYIAINSSSA